MPRPGHMNLLHPITRQRVRIINYPYSGYPQPNKDVTQLTPTGNPDYYAFGNLVRFSADSLKYYAKLGPTHILGTNIFGMDYNGLNDTWGAPYQVAVTGDADIYSGVSAGIIGTKIFIHVAKYNVGSDLFTDIGYIKSTDLTGTSWGSYTSFGATTYERFEAYGKIVGNDTPGTYFMPWFEHKNGGSDPWRINVRKTTDSGDNWTNINIYDGASLIGEPSVVHITGTSAYLCIARNNAASPNAKLHLFSSTDNCATWTNIGITNLGAGTGHCVVDTLYYDGLIHVIFQDRGTGYIRISKNNTYMQCLDLNFNTPIDYWDNNDSDSLNGLGYPSMVLMREPDVLYITFCKETSTGEAHVYGTLDTIGNIA